MGKEKVIGEAKVEVVEVFDEGSDYVKFKKPFHFEGVDYDGVALNLQGLTGAAIEESEVTFVNLNPQIAAQTPLKEMSKGFLAIVASKAAKKPLEFFKALPAAEYSKVTTKVQVFLMSGE